MNSTQIQRGQKWLKQLLQLMGVSTEVEAQLHTTSGQDSDLQQVDSYWLTIDQTNLTPEQLQILIGANGTVLDAMQYLANTTLNLHQPEEQQAAYTTELNGYRLRRQAEILALANEAASRVRASGQEVEIKSLSSAERRQIHTLLQEFTDLETFSRGKEPHRHLVVRQVQQVGANDS